MEGCEAYRLVEMSEMAVDHAQQLVANEVHDATAHVTCRCILNAMHENTCADRGSTIVEM